MPERGPAGRAMTPGTPETRRRWNGAASGMLAVVLEALGAEPRALGRNPSGGNGLYGPSAARALRSVRTARGGYLRKEDRWELLHVVTCANTCSITHRD